MRRVRPAPSADVTPGLRPTAFRAFTIPIRDARRVFTLGAEHPVWDAAVVEPLLPDDVAKLVAPRGKTDEEVRVLVAALRSRGAVVKVEGAPEEASPTPGDAARPSETLRAVVERVAEEVATEDRAALRAVVHAANDKVGL
jgi:hypothetical protein